MRIIHERLSDFYREATYVERSLEQAIYYCNLSVEQGGIDTLAAAGELYYNELQYDKDFELFSVASIWENLVVTIENMLQIFASWKRQL